MIELTIDERIALADKAISEILERYQVEFCGEYESEMWLEPLEDEKPRLTVV